MIVDRLPSRIDGQARSNPELIAANSPRPARSSSLVRSAIRMFASTAKPNERITAAAPDSVKVTGTNLNAPNSITA